MDEAVSPLFRLTSLVYNTRNTVASCNPNTWNKSTDIVPLINFNRDFWGISKLAQSKMFQTAKLLCISIDHQALAARQLRVVEKNCSLQHQYRKVYSLKISALLLIFSHLLQTTSLSLHFSFLFLTFKLRVLANSKHRTIFTPCCWTIVASGTHIPAYLLRCRKTIGPKPQPTTFLLIYKACLEIDILTTAIHLQSD
jgi:hypothetical protein